MVDSRREIRPGRPEGDLLKPECELLKSWVHDLEKTLSRIKGLLREAEANQPKEGLEKQV
jgi:hypothetical protein